MLGLFEIEVRVRIGAAAFGAARAVAKHRRRCAELRRLQRLPTVPRTRPFTATNKTWPICVPDWMSAGESPETSNLSPSPIRIRFVAACLDTAKIGNTCCRMGPLLGVPSAGPIFREQVRTGYWVSIYRSPPTGHYERLFAQNSRRLISPLTLFSDHPV